jgi:tetratricopeptide (TPR) repeat protein
MQLLRYPALRARLNLENEDLHNLPGRQITVSRFQTENDSLKAARYAYENKDYALADELIVDALLSSPNDLETIKLAGQIKKHTADVEAAIQSSELVALFEPDNQANKKSWLTSSCNRGSRKKALEIYQEIISANAQPSRSDLLIYADIAIKQEKPDMASLFVRAS